MFPAVGSDTPTDRYHVRHRRQPQRYRYLLSRQIAFSLNTFSRQIHKQLFKNVIFSTEKTAKIGWVFNDVLNTTSRPSVDFKTKNRMPASLRIMLWRAWIWPPIYCCICFIGNLIGTLHKSCLARENRKRAGRVMAERVTTLQQKNIIIIGTNRSHVGRDNFYDSSR